MQLKLYGDLDKFNIPLVRNKARLFARHLLGEELYKECGINVHFDKHLLANENRWGEATFYYSHWNEPKRRFKISLYSGLETNHQLLKVLAHETAHVAQWATGVMVDRKNGDTIFQKVKYGYQVHHESDPPWEIDANAAENLLAELYLKDVDN